MRPRRSSSRPRLSLEEEKQMYEVQLDHLSEMGFSNVEDCCEALHKCNGNVMIALEMLMSKEEKEEREEKE